MTEPKVSAQCLILLLPIPFWLSKWELGCKRFAVCGLRCARLCPLVRVCMIGKVDRDVPGSLGKSFLFVAPLPLTLSDKLLTQFANSLRITRLFSRFHSSGPVLIRFAPI
ncbi:hypothetical protein F4810DRAFT_97516 [Camillea tinctor]|nr:hypothetical protein F4810DRAFT_97516 [Camillea tinctor]